jgi:CheY-like chemotaxis protein
VLKTSPDVAIVDYSLPLLDGVGVTRQIRQRSPGIISINSLWLRREW